MDTITRQPFAPLDGSRLQTLTSLKNRQNAIPPSPAKRKTRDVLDADDFENVDPTLFAKRAKGSVDTFVKPSTFFLAKSTSAPSLVPQDASGLSSPLAAPARPRSYLQPKSPIARLNTAAAPPACAPRTAPAGRSPTRGTQRIGILSNSRRRLPAPPSFGLSTLTPFSLDAALKGTIPSYNSPTPPAAAPPRAAPAIPGSADLFLAAGSTKAASWVFDIHEDTPEQEMTNLLQHGTCTLDISSDDECAQRASRERAEGKENIPPLDDASPPQTATTAARRGARASVLGDGGVEVEKPRGPLADLDVAEHVPAGVHLDAVVLVPADEDEGSVGGEDAGGLVLGPVMDGETPARSIDEIMDVSTGGAKAAVLQPIEGTGQSFELWESESVTGKVDVVASAAA